VRQPQVVLEVQAVARRRGVDARVEDAQPPVAEERGGGQRGRAHGLPRLDGKVGAVLAEQGGKAFAIAAEDTGFLTAGGLYKPNNIYVDLGRAHYLENIHNIVNQLIDFCGRGVVMAPTRADFDRPYLGPKLEEALRGSAISARDRVSIFRQISERYLTQWGARNEMFEKFNGTPLYLVKLLTMQRTEYQVDGPLTDLARQVLALRLGQVPARVRPRAGRPGRLLPAGQPGLTCGAAGFRPRSGPGRQRRDGSARARAVTSGR